MRQFDRHAVVRGAVAEGPELPVVHRHRLLQHGQQTAVQGDHVRAVGRQAFLRGLQVIQPRAAITRRVEAGGLDPLAGLESSFGAEHRDREVTG